MHTGTLRRLPLGVLLVALALAGARAGDKYKAAELKEAAPKELTAEVRGALAKSGYRVTGPDGKTVCDVWLVAELPIADAFQEQLDLKYPIEPGTLVGAIRFPADTADYRKQQIKAGVYTLRYGHQPQDGNHLGTAQFRDFVILGPAASDKSPAGLSQDDATELSTKVTKKTHPAILSLLPPQAGRKQLPAMAHDDTLNLEVLVAKTAGKAGKTTKDVQIELVAVGHAPE
jgi:hypothetical protein